ncbi:MAG: LptF/LptG family permease, partial [Pyrinomonadaceae bacterium]
MGRGMRLIERYTVAASLPYFALSLLLLTAVLVAQQATRFSEILGMARAPLGLAAEITLGLLPNILIFTLPMSVLVGTATGFSRMSADSELVAIRAAGIGTVRIVFPLLGCGCVLSAVTLYVGMGMAPAAARRLRQATLRAAIYRLESPVEPRVFNTEMPGKVIYVRDGDREQGQWGRVFIHWQEGDGPTRLITARTGRIDSTGEQTELVLSDAVVTTLPAKPATGAAERANSTGEAGARQFTTERSSQLRIRDDRLNAARGALLKRLRERDLEFDEMGWRELLRHAGSVEDGGRRHAAAVTLHKRLSLCLAPVVFAMLGTGLGLRARRGGRGLGVMLSMAAMIAYYLVALAGEQLARAG